MVEVTYVGGKSFVTLTAEATFGTYDTTASEEKWVLATNFTNPRKNNMIRLYALGGGRNYVQAVPGKFEVDGTLEYDLQNGALLKYAFGTIGSWAWATDTWTRTAGSAVPTYHPAYDLDGSAITGTPTALCMWSIREGDVLTSFTINQVEISTATTYDTQMRYLGCKVNQFSIRADTEKPLHVTLDWIGQSELLVKDMETVTEPTTPGTLTDVVSMFYRGSLLIGGTVAVPTADTYSGTEIVGPAKVTTADTVIACNSVECKGTNSLEKYFSINNTTGRGTQYLLEKQREYSLTLDLNFVNTDQLHRFYNGTKTGTGPLSCENYTPFTVVLDYRSCLTLGDDFQQFRIIFSDVYFDETSIPVTPTDIVKQTVSAIAKKCDVYYITAEAQL